jgi:hypothetical protein
MTSVLILPEGLFDILVLFAGIDVIIIQDASRQYLRCLMAGISPIYRRQTKMHRAFGVKIQLPYQHCAFKGLFVLR